MVARDSMTRDYEVRSWMIRTTNRMPAAEKVAALGAHQNPSGPRRGIGASNASRGVRQSRLSMSVVLRGGCHSTQPHWQAHGSPTTAMTREHFEHEVARRST